MFVNSVDMDWILEMNFEATLDMRHVSCSFKYLRLMFLLHWGSSAYTVEEKIRRKCILIKSFQNSN
jgi:hypothetical protein